MKYILTLFILLYYSEVFSNERFFLIKEFANIHMQPSIESPVIYPIEQGKELVLKKDKDNWANVLDEKTGLVGWIQKDLISKKNLKILLNQKTMKVHLRFLKVEFWK